MPRVHPERSLVHERNLARRIAHEREQRGMSYAGLADRMTRSGMPMQKATIFKIEEGDPPRRITVDELVGFASVFGIDVSDLLVPVELVHEREAARLLKSARAGASTVVAAAQDMYRAWRAVSETSIYRPTRQRHLFAAYLDEAAGAAALPAPIAAHLGKLPIAFAASDKAVGNGEH